MAVNRYGCRVNVNAQSIRARERCFSIENSTTRWKKYNESPFSIGRRSGRNTCRAMSRFDDHEPRGLRSHTIRVRLPAVIVETATRLSGPFPHGRARVSGSSGKTEYNMINYGDPRRLCPPSRKENAAFSFAKYRAVSRRPSSLPWPFHHTNHVRTSHSRLVAYGRICFFFFTFCTWSGLQKRSPGFQKRTRDTECWARLFLLHFKRVSNFFFY